MANNSKYGTSSYTGKNSAAASQRGIVGPQGTVGYPAPPTSIRSAEPGQPVSYFAAPKKPKPSYAGVGYAPNPTPAAPKAPGVLTTPGEGEQWWSQNKGMLNNRMGELDNKGYVEQLYESGNQGLNTFYDREHEKRQKRLADQMSAMGIFDSGSGAKALFELEAEMGANQARDMSNLAGAADASKMARYGEGRATADSIFGMGRQTQNLFQDRERLPLQDKATLASNLSGLFQNFSSKSADEQGQIQEQVIQSIIADGGVDRAAAEQQAADMFRMYGIAVNAGAPKPATTYPSTTAQTGRPYAPG